MSLKDRETLKNLFTKGRIPSEAGFADLIDSGINKIDDGFSKSIKDGLMLSPMANSKNVLGIYRKIIDPNAAWSVQLDDIKGSDQKSLGICGQGLQTPVLQFHPEGKVGINTSQPARTLDVNGFIATRGVTGSYSAQREVPADGEWYPIIQNLDYCNAFEVVARVGVPKSGVHALLHAIALSAYGNSHSRIKHTHTRFSLWRPLKIKLRWVGSTHQYTLEMRSTRNLGPYTKIRYYITQLWDDLEMGSPEHFNIRK